MVVHQVGGGPHEPAPEILAGSSVGVNRLQKSQENLRGKVLRRHGVAHAVVNVAIELREVSAVDGADRMGVEAPELF
jgi:hypothetical protein